MTTKTTTSTPASIGDQITEISHAARTLLDADPATRKGVLLLIAHTSGLSQKKVKQVIEAASQLKRKYVP